MKHPLHSTLRFILISAACISACAASAVRTPFAYDPPMKDSRDTLIIEELLNLDGLSPEKPGKNCAVIAQKLIGSKEDNYYRMDSTARLRLNPETFTPLTFINTVAALSKAKCDFSRPGWRDFADCLVAMSCRRGEEDGFASLMWHAGDWVGDNIYRGNLRELTEDYSGAVSRTKSLDHYSRNRGDYAALSDSATYEKVRMTEMGFRTHRVPMLKKETINKKEVVEDLRDGDIIILNPQEDGIDIRKIGFVVNREDGPHLIHLDEERGEVVEESEPLPRWFKMKTKYFNGYRILRLK